MVLKLVPLLMLEGRPCVRLSTNDVLSLRRGFQSAFDGISRWVFKAFGAFLPRLATG